LLLCGCAAGPNEIRESDNTANLGPVGIIRFETPAPRANGETASSTDKRAYEIPDYYRTSFVSSPSLSPDGSKAAFVVRHYDLEKNESWSEIWRIDLASGEMRQMTQGRHADGDPQFSPDGATLLFVSDREGGSQLWVMSVDGGEPSQLTHFQPGVSDPLYSPDGSFLAVASEVWPDCGADGELHEKREKTMEASKLSVHVADELLYRHWTSWSDGKVSHVLLVDAKSGKVVRDLTPGRFPAPTYSLGGDRGFAFSPDGKELCFVSDHEPDQAESTNADLWVVSLAEDADLANPACLTAANDGWDGAPLYSPDGRSIAFISQATPRYESDLRRLAVLDRASGGVRYLTSRDHFDDWVGDMRWSADGESLYFQADHHGRTPIWKIAARGGEPALVHTHASIDAWELAPDSRSLVYVRRSVGEPPELLRFSPGGQPEQLTHFNDALAAEVDMRPAEEMWVDGDAGQKIHLFVVKPHGFDPAKRYPLVLNVHGGPQSQWTDSYRGDWQVYPGKGYVVAFANPTGSTGYGQEFCDAIGRDWGGRVFRDLMKVTDALAALPYVDPDRMGSMGWSFGGYMMMWFQGHTDRFRCQAAMMGLYDLPAFYGSTEELWFPEHDLAGSPWTSEDYERWSPSNSVKSFKTPALVITGELDYRVPYTQSLEYFTALQKLDIPSRLVVYPKAGHWPAWREMAFYYNAHLDWFHRWLGGEAAPYDVAEFARAECKLGTAPKE
jgi:dipeptidyl aminopeptidase/acylaminoacyl peptidase